MIIRFEIDGDFADVQRLLTDLEKLGYTHQTADTETETAVYITLQPLIRYTV